MGQEAECPLLSEFRVPEEWQGGEGSEGARVSRGQRHAQRFAGTDHLGLTRARSADAQTKARRDESPLCGGHRRLEGFGTQAQRFGSRS